ncbi:TonB-dependent siderophore receptor [Tatumella saanichensis]|uniref:TonB-dependent siderophore receptor n=1 Tax=Tatumella saanichensis TaxID=480813 RepID=UPI0004A377D3|nr:TonB-dependent siderophore receptor [Tatumella saanichensis]
MARYYRTVFPRLLVGSTLIVSPALWAAEQTELEVYANGRSAASSQSVATYTNSATKSAVPESRTPQVIDSISYQEIEKRHTNSLNEILRYDAGVASEMRGATSYMSEYKIRGFAAEHEYYNGLQLPYNVSGNTKASIDPILIEQVDILKGPSSVLYGNASPGGLVNIQGKMPQSTAHTEVGVMTGNRQLREGYIDSTGRLAQSDWSYRLIAKGSAGQDQAVTTRHESYLVAPSVRWQPDDQTRLTLDALYQNQPSLTPSSPLPLAYLRSGYTSRRAYAGDHWNGFRQRQGMLGYSFEHQFDNGWGVIQKARYFTVDTHQQSLYATGSRTVPTELTRFGYTTDEGVDSINIDNQLTRSFTAGGGEHHLLAGFDYQHLNSPMTYRYATTSPGIDMLHPDYGLMESEKAGLYTAKRQRLRFNQRGYYLQEHSEFGGLNLMAGLRYDDYQSSTTDYLNQGQKTSVDQQRLTKRLGVLYQFSEGIAPFLSYSEGFLPVSPQGTLTSDQAKATTSRQVEGGVKYLLADYATTLTTSLFEIRQKNVLTTDYTYTAAGLLNYRQTGEIRSRGAEVTLVSRPTDNLNLIASYAYTHAINTRDELYQGQRATQVPENRLTLWGDYTFDQGALSGLMAGAGLRYNGKTAITPDNSVAAMGGNTQFDAAVSYDMGQVSPSLKGLTVKASAQNLTNKMTYTCYSSSYCWIGRDRSWQAGVSYSF